MATAAFAPLSARRTAHQARSRCIRPTRPGCPASRPYLPPPPFFFIRAASRHDPLLGQWMKSPQMLTAFLTPGSPYHATPGSPYPGQPLQLLHTPGRSPASCRPQTSTPALPGYATIPSPGSAQHQDRTLDTRPPHSRNPITHSSRPFHPGAAQLCKSGPWPVKQNPVRPPAGLAFPASHRLLGWRPAGGGPGVAPAPGNVNSVPRPDHPDGQIHRRVLLAFRHRFPAPM